MKLFSQLISTLSSGLVFAAVTMFCGLYAKIIVIMFQFGWSLI